MTRLKPGMTVNIRPELQEFWTDKTLTIIRFHRGGFVPEMPSVFYRGRGWLCVDDEGRYHLHERRFLDVPAYNAGRKGGAR